MKLVLTAALAAVFSTALFAQAPEMKPLKIGDVAPDFTLPTQSPKDGKTTKVTLSEYRGKKAVVLAFFPAAFTGG